MRILGKTIGYILSILILLLVALTAGLLTLHWWLPPVIPHLAEWAGAKVDNAAYESGGRLILNDLEYEADGIQFYSAHTEILLPTYWLWWGWRDQLGQHSVLRVDSWNLKLDLPQTDEDEEAAAELEPDLPGYFEQAMQFWKIGLQWVPNFSLSNGHLSWNEQHFQLNQIQKTGRTFLIEAQWPEQQLLPALASNLSLQLQFESTTDNQTVDIQWQIPEERVEGELTLQDAGQGQLLAGGRVGIPAGNSRFQASWSKGSWIPETANIQTDRLELNPSQFSTEAPNGTVYTRLDARWQAEQYHFDLELSTEAPMTLPQSGHTLNSISGKASGHGNMDTVQIEALQLHTDGIALKLDAPLQLQLQPFLPLNQASLNLNIDLANQPFIEASGTLAAQVAITGTDAESFHGTFSIVGNAIQTETFSLSELSTSGEFSPKRIQLTPSFVLLPEGHRLTIEEGEIQFPAPGQQEADLITHLFLQSGYQIALVGKIQTSFPTDEQASPSQARAIADLQLEFLHPDEKQGEFSLQFDLDPQHRKHGTLQFHGFLSDFSWIQELSSELPDLTALKLDSTRASLQWQEGPLTGNVEWELDYRISDSDTLQTQGKLQLTEQSTDIPEMLLAILEDSEETAHPVLRLTGKLPVNLFPANTESPLGWRENDPWNLHLKLIAEESWIHRKMEDLPFKISEPQLELTLEGTPFHPEGHIVLSSPELHLAESMVRELDEDLPTPTIKDLQFRIEITPETLHLLPSGFSVMDTPLEIEASLPWQPGDLIALVQNQKIPDMDPLSGYLRMENFSLESLAAVLPEMLRPQGILTIHINKEPHHFPTGNIQLADLATLPLGAMGTLDGIQADLVINERDITLNKGEFQIGGMPVFLSGHAVLQPEQALPEFRIEIKGEDIPFIRSPGLILRTDLDLLITNQDRDVPLIGGNLILRDSISLIDLSQLDSNPQSPSQRPPYFSVDHPIFGNWRLDIRINGNRFLRIRTPVLDGTLSAQVNLVGTLKEPQSIGNATLHDSRIKFPFAGFSVDQGTITLTRSNPYDPQLSINASTQALGYSLQMELTGTASEPQLLFSSTPPLDSSQILLMVSTGQPPAGEINRSAQSRLGTLGLYLGSGLLGSSGDDDSFFSRLSMESGQRVSEQGKETMEVQYRISDRWFLIGEYDEFDAYNMDVKWKIFTR